MASPEVVPDGEPVSADAEVLPDAPPMQPAHEEADAPAPGRVHPLGFTWSAKRLRTGGAEIKLAWEHLKGVSSNTAGAAAARPLQPAGSTGGQQSAGSTGQSPSAALSPAAAAVPAAAAAAAAEGSIAPSPAVVVAPASPVVELQQEQQLLPAPKVEPLEGAGSLPLPSEQGSPAELIPSRATPELPQSPTPPAAHVTPETVQTTTEGVRRSKRARRAVSVSCRGRVQPAGLRSRRLSLA